LKGHILYQMRIFLQPRRSGPFIEFSTLEIAFLFGKLAIKNATNLVLYELVDFGLGAFVVKRIILSLEKNNSKCVIFLL